MTASAAERRIYANASTPCPECALGCHVAFHTNPTPMRRSGGCAQCGCLCKRTRDPFSGVAVVAVNETRKAAPALPPIVMKRRGPSGYTVEKKQKEPEEKP